MNEDYRSLQFRIDFSLELGSMSVLIEHLKCKTLKYCVLSLFCISIKSGSAPDLLILISIFASGRPLAQRGAKDGVAVLTWGFVLV